MFKFLYLVKRGLLSCNIERGIEISNKEFIMFIFWPFYTILYYFRKIFVRGAAYITTSTEQACFMFLLLFKQIIKLIC